MEEQIFTDSNLDIPISEDKLKGFLKNIPKQPGVYKFLDENKCPIYIGKAKNLFNRVPSYFQENKQFYLKFFVIYQNPMTFFIRMLMTSVCNQ